MTETQTATVAQYLYGVVPSGTPLPDGLTGVDGRPVRTEPLGQVEALVSDLPDLQSFGRADDIRAHTAVLDTIAEQAAVLPMVFATIIDDAGALPAAVPPDLQETYLAALGEIHGAAQLTLRVQYVQETVLAELIAQDRRIAQLREAIAGRSEEESYHERVQLGELVVGELERRRPQEAAHILEVLESSAQRISQREVSQAEDVLEVALLVPRQHLADFEDVVEDLAAARAERMKFRLVGPQAPYDFVPEG